MTSSPTTSSHAPKQRFAATKHDILLIAAPLLSWSRFRIPSTSIAPAGVANLRVHLQAHILADDVKLAVADFLFSPDQLPAGYCATAQFADALGQAALEQRDLHIDPAMLAETNQFLSDTRYLLAAVAVPRARHCSAGNSRAVRANSPWSSGGRRAAPAWPRCCPAVRLKSSCPKPISPPAGRRPRQPPLLGARLGSLLGTTLETPASSLRAVVAPSTTSS